VYYQAWLNPYQSWDTLITASAAVLKSLMTVMFMLSLLASAKADMILLASTSLVPFRRTTTGIVRPTF